VACHQGSVGSISCHSLWDLWWTEWHWDNFFFEYFLSSLLVWYHQFSILIFMYMYMLVLPEGQTAEAWEPSKPQCSLGNRGALDRKVLSLFFSIEGLSRLKNKSDVHNLLLSTSQKTHCAYVVLGEIITVYFQNYTKQKKQHKQSLGASVHYTEATCSTFLNQTPKLLRQLIKLLPFYRKSRYSKHTLSWTT